MSEYSPRPKESPDDRSARLQRQADEAADAVRDYMASEAQKIANLARLRALRSKQ